MSEQVSVGIRDFELQIIKDFQLGGKLRVSPKAQWLKDHLKDVGEDYAHQMYKQWRIFCEVSGHIRTREDDTHRKPANIKAGTYNSFTTFLWLLHNRLGLLKLSRVETVRPNVARKFQRRYYALNLSELDNEAWEHPFQSVYPSSDWRNMTPDQRRHYRKQWRKKRPKKKRGRPPKHSYGIQGTDH